MQLPHPTHQLTVTGTGTRCSPGSGGFVRPRTSHCSGARESGLRPGPVQAGSGREAGEWWPRSLDSWTRAWGPCRKGRGGRVPALPASSSRGDRPPPAPAWLLPRLGWRLPQVQGHSPTSGKASEATLRPPAGWGLVTVALRSRC